jgi:DNA-directed RNA polymerase specialized sigma24 family protein
MDADRFDAFDAGSVHRLVGVLSSMTGDLPEAQDVQEAFVRTRDQRHSPALVHHPEAWVRTVASRVVAVHEQYLP